MEEDKRGQGSRLDDLIKNMSDKLESMDKERSEMQKLLEDLKVEREKIAEDKYQRDLDRYFNEMVLEDLNRDNKGIDANADKGSDLSLDKLGDTGKDLDDSEFEREKLAEDKYQKDLDRYFEDLREDNKGTDLENFNSDSSQQNLNQNQIQISKQNHKQSNTPIPTNSLGLEGSPSATPLTNSLLGVIGENSENSENSKNSVIGENSENDDIDKIGEKSIDGVHSSLRIKKLDDMNRIKGEPSLLGIIGENRIKDVNVSLGVQIDNQKRIKGEPSLLGIIGENRIKDVNVSLGVQIDNQKRIKGEPSLLGIIGEKNINSENDENSVHHIIKDRDIVNTERVRPQPIPQPAPQQIPQSYNQGTPLSQFTGSNKIAKSNSDIENKIGKTVMGILGSVLIFVGLAAFVGMIYQDLSDAFKMLLMFLFSFGLFGVGFYKLNKCKDAFSISLTGCGVGAVFISIIVSYFYFNVLSNPFIFFGLLLLWCFCVCLISQKFESDTFFFISYLGLFISIVMGIMSDVMLFNSRSITVLLLAGLQIGSLILVNKEKLKISETSLKVFNVLGVLVNIFLLVYTFNCRVFEYTTIASLPFITLAILIIGFLISFYFIIEKFLDTRVKVSKVFVTFICILCVYCSFFSLKTLAYNNVNFLSEDRASAIETVRDKEYSDYQDDYLENHGYEEYKENNYKITGIQTHKTIYDDWFLVLIIGFMGSLLYFNKSRELKKNYVGLYYYNLFFTCYLGIRTVSEFNNGFIGSIMGYGIVGAVLFLYYLINSETERINHIEFYLGSFIYFLSMMVVQDFIYFDNVLLAMSEEMSKVIELFIFAGMHIVYLLIMGKVLKVYNKELNASTKVIYHILIFMFIYFIVNQICNVLGEYIIMTTGLEIGEPAYEYFHNDFTSLVVFLLMGAFGLFVKESRFCQKWCDSSIPSSRRVLKLKDKTEPVEFVYKWNSAYIILCLCISVVYMYSIKTLYPISLTVMLLMTSLLCFGDIKEDLYSEDKWKGYYTCIKITLYINAILGLFVESDVGYLYSIVSLIIAVSAIALGFKFKRSSFRLYGLILSILCILKLLLIDIYYDNSLTRIASFIFSGLLCFGIVWLYNMYEKKVKANENNIDELEESQNIENLNGIGYNNDYYNQSYHQVYERNSENNIDERQN